jgi:hypothetical protein
MTLTSLLVVTLIMRFQTDSREEQPKRGEMRSTKLLISDEA